MLFEDVSILTVTSTGISKLLLEKAVTVESLRLLQSRRHQSVVTVDN